MGVTVGGVSLDSLVWNVRTRAGRWGTAARRGGNIPMSGMDGTVWTPNKPLDEMEVDLDMWILGCGTDGSMPDSAAGKTLVRQRRDQLYRLMANQRSLFEVVDTESNRRCMAELGGGVSPVVQAGGTRAEVTFPLLVPAGCWEDGSAVTTSNMVLTASGSYTLTGLGGGTLPLQGLVITLTPPARNIVLTVSDGSTLLWNGDLPAGGTTVIRTDPAAPRARHNDTGLSLMGAVMWTPGPGLLTIPEGTTDPVVTITAEATSGASRVQFSGRRRWHAA
jgi:hypothetical protein